MAFITRTFEQLRNDLLRDIKNALPDADIDSDSDFYIRASSVASVAEGLYRHQSWIVRQIFPNTADTEYLELHARTRGIRRKRATTASGKIKLTGAVGAVINAGLEVKRDKLTWLTTSAATVDSNGIAVVTASSSILGTAGNTLSNLTAMLVSAPSGVDSTVTIEKMTGGTEAETDAALLARLLELIRRPPAGGNQYDYRRWALEVDGVSNAHIYPLRRGLGTVDIVIISANGLPSLEIIQSTQIHIDDVRPVTAKGARVFAPTIKSVDFVIKITIENLTLAEAITLINERLVNYVKQLAPGETLIRSQAESEISLIPGIIDRQIIQPTTNITAAVNTSTVEWIKVGTINVELQS